MKGYYVGPVILATEEEERRKERHIEIFKNEVYKDIDLYTHKHVDAREDLGGRSSNAISSDIGESVDHAVIARYVMFRDSQLRLRLQWALEEESVAAANDLIDLDDSKFYYFLKVNEGFNDNTLRAIAEYIHRFLVFGALYDWYSQFGDNAAQRLAQNYKVNADEAEEAITGILKGPSIAKRPMQPFGPAEKIY